VRTTVIEVTIVVAVLLLAAPLAVEAQQAGQAIPTVGVLAPSSPQVGYTAFVDTLRQLGYDPDRNLRLLFRSAEGKLARLPALATELVEARVDVIVAINTPGTHAAIQATTQIPIVMAIVGDPVGSGFVSNLARPGGNITGISNMGAELGAKRLELFTEAVPGAKRIAVLLNPADPITVPQRRDTERAAPRLGVELRFFPVREPEELPATFTQIRAWQADAVLWIAGQAQTFQPGAIALAAQHRLPMMVGRDVDVEAGGLLSYAADQVELFRRTATYVDRILRGTKPGDLPVEQPMRFQLVINLKTAKALGLTIPPLLLFQADRLIE
jgi:putative ABC transport system substrate-binding protein